MLRSLFPSIVGIVLLAVTGGPSLVAGAGHAFEVGRLESGVRPAPVAEDCGELLINADESYENAYAWNGFAVAPPDWSAFAEFFSGQVTVCALVFDLTQIGLQADETLDAYVWDDAGGEPGPVVSVVTEVAPGPVAYWPEMSRHVVPMAASPSGEAWWAGLWSAWPFQEDAAWFVGADLNGPGGTPKVKVAPDLGYTTGWNDVSLVWGPTQAMGIGVEHLTTTPTSDSSWGDVKSLFR
ncbi:MAG: hypothetical protein R3E97_14890 [Candidatus Eisenbacteria bacterium]